MKVSLIDFSTNFWRLWRSRSWHLPSLESLIFSFEQNQLATLLQDIGFCMIFLLILQEHRRDVRLAGIDGGTLLHLTSRNGLPIPVQNRYVYTYVYKEFHNEHISTICFFFWQQSCSLTHNVLPSITVLLLLILVLLAVSCVSPFTFSFFPQIPGSYMGFLLLKGQVFRGELCGEVWQRCCAGCCAGCCPECGYVRLLCRLSRVRSSCGVARSQAAVQSVVARSGKGAVQRAVPAAVAAVRRCLCGEVWQGCCAGCCAGCCPKCSGEGAAQAVRCRSLAKVLCRVLRRLLSTVRGRCIVKDFVGHETRLCTVSFLKVQRLSAIGMKSVPAGNRFVHGLA